MVLERQIHGYTPDRGYIVNVFEAKVKIQLNSNYFDGPNKQLVALHE